MKNPEAQQEIHQTMDSIVQTVEDGNLDELFAFLAYNPKFTEFRNGELRNDDQANEAFERYVFGSVKEVTKFNMNDIKIAV
ncbi:MAG: hypothetical protein WBG71_08795 [Leeuwenhoekiella sp.]